MIERTSVTFSQLAALLLELGFTQDKRGDFWRFEHTPTETVFPFRPYRANERVTWMDLEMVRKHLDWRGVMETNLFDDRMKATA